ncbi:MAG: hypothetical protein MZV64_33750 [Ignavibacteriales bacterium]|nr:hypothetical protein [Ignavibacteriales bacterium]
MPSLSDLRKNYGGGIRDLDFYARLGKEGIISSWVKFYDFPDSDNFFPRSRSSLEPGPDGRAHDRVPRLHDPLYFKNPGFVKGDKLTIKVRDVKNPAVTGECEVVLD